MRSLFHMVACSVRPLVCPCVSYPKWISIKVGTLRTHWWLSEEFNTVASPSIDVSLINDLIHRYSHNMSKYPNVCHSPIDRRSQLHTRTGILTSSPTSANHSGNVVMQAYRCSSSLSIFFIFINKIREIMDHAMESRANVVMRFVNQRFSNQWHFMEPVNVD